MKKIEHVEMVQVTKTEQQVTTRYKVEATLTEQEADLLMVLLNSSTSEIRRYLNIPEPTYVPICTLWEKVFCYFDLDEGLTLSSKEYVEKHDSKAFAKKYS